MPFSSLPGYVLFGKLRYRKKHPWGAFSENSSIDQNYKSITVELAYQRHPSGRQNVDVIWNCGKIDNVTSLVLSATVRSHMLCEQPYYTHSF